MIGILKRTYKLYLERQTKNVTYYWFSENPDVVRLTYYKREEKQKVF